MKIFSCQYWLVCTVVVKRPRGILAAVSSWIKTSSMEKTRAGREQTTIVNALRLRVLMKYASCGISPVLYWGLCRLIWAGKPSHPYSNAWPTKPPPIKPVIHSINYYRTEEILNEQPPLNFSEMLIRFMRSYLHWRCQLTAINSINLVNKLIFVLSMASPWI